ncbi:hypothetical protein GDO81_028220 [Engystomops pustulosus]|uniref:Uncharacterized protein n=1 Tax=Engystomops pustulosus TaxID=76066 RepID=A0AAV6ZES3_ENGPU|nr:hypothetical protein GDO81_028220 [Engystomops pustulosus]
MNPEEVSWFQSVLLVACLCPCSLNGSSQSGREMGVRRLFVLFVSPVSRHLSAQLLSFSYLFLKGEGPAELAAPDGLLGLKLLLLGELYRYLLTLVTPRSVFLSTLQHKSNQPNLRVQRELSGPEEGANPAPKRVVHFYHFYHLCLLLLLCTQNL